MEEAKNLINDLEYKEGKTTNGNKKKKTIQKKHSVSSLNFKCSNICIIGVLEGEEKEEEIGIILKKIMKENFP